jgi:hypothetical protein
MTRTDHREEQTIVRGAGGPDTAVFQLSQVRVLD